MLRAAVWHTALVPLDLHGAQLLEAIFANPASEVTRRVFADWLLERDDPWGRFIVAQLDHDLPEAWRLLPLVRERAALGWPNQSALDREFTGGFLTRVRLVDAPVDTIEALSTLLVWGVVRFLDCPFAADERLATVLGAAAKRGRLRGLRSYFGDSSLLDAIALADPTPRLDVAVVRGAFEGPCLSLVHPHAEVVLEHDAGFTLRRAPDFVRPASLVAGAASVTQMVGLATRLLPSGSKLEVFEARPKLVAALEAAGLEVHAASRRRRGQLFVAPSRGD